MITNTSDGELRVELDWRTLFYSSTAVTLWRPDDHFLLFIYFKADFSRIHIEILYIINIEET